MGILHIFPTMSIGMYDPDLATPIVRSIRTDEAREMIGNDTQVKLHFKVQSITETVSEIIGVKATYEKIDVDLKAGDTCLVAKYIGPKIVDETLPVSPSRLRFYEVTFFSTSEIEDALFGSDGQ